MILFESIVSFYAFLNDIIPYFPMYIDQLPGTSATEVVVTRIIMSVISHLADESIYNNIKSRLVLVNLVSECWLEYEKYFQNELYQNLVSQILLILKHCIYSQ